MSTTVPVTAASAEPSTAADSAQFGALVRAHRLRIGLTQRELADLSTISVRAIRDLEQGKARRPRTDTIRLIADALRLGPRARAALEAAAQQGRCAGAAGGLFDGEPPAPPTALHGLTGREAEAGVLVRELGSGSERLVNVVGLSGAGKTRLALEAANRLYAAGLPVLWHAFPGAPRDYLAAADAGPAERLVAELVAYLFEAGPGDEGRLPAQPVGDRPVLLVLDGAPERAPRCDRLTRLLREFPGLRLLVTSEHPWGLPGERPFLLGPLEVPVEGAAESAAVGLFLDHARRVRPEFAPSGGELADVVRVCARLDGHPVALAAAASWLAVCDLPALRRSVDADPAALLDHLAGGDGGRRFREGLQRGLRRLTDGQRALLADLCTAPGDGAGADGSGDGRGDGCGNGSGDGFGLDEIVALTGRGLPESGRMVRDLLIAGVIRAGHEAGRSRFRVLHLVRAFHRSAEGAPPAALAAAGH
ncbi:helix-turn-helix domain-containing protein [Streptomyces bambusae]|uniref:helix-turn-helix domain-containing protein n=1 Tax=Streptomyces bambusae TaxID=1550616 RepID=UPI0021F69A39|nr:helix-turn-helix domain-containing protein [Streptomyces bambusae]